VAAKTEVTIGLKVLELNADDLDFIKRFDSTATPTRTTHMIVQQAVADTAEVLPVGDVGTVELIILKCVTNDVDIDTSYVSSFNAEIEVQEGEWAVFKPTGTVWFKNDDSAEQSTVEYWVVGT
jgi:hypothetical protein